MEYQRFGSRIVVRMDRGEEVLAQLAALCRAEQIHLAEVHALGALSRFTVGLFDPAAQQYFSNTFDMPAEITSLWGTVTEKDGAPYLHIHLSAALRGGTVLGGHLSEAVVGPTCEMVLDVLDGTVGRRFDPDTGLNLFVFSAPQTLPPQ